MKNLMLYLFIVLSPSHLFAQIKLDSKSDSLYSNLIAQLKVRQDFPVFYKTSLHTLKKVDFKHTNLKQWAKRDTVAGWNPFFKSVNLELIKEFDLQTGISLHPLVRERFIEDKQHLPQPFLELSPVIYSAHKKLALCSVYNWTGRESASETVYLLELKENKWRIVSFLLVSIS